MGKRIRTLEFVLAALVAGVFGREVARSVSDRKPDPKSVEFLTKVAGEINKTMPMMVDSDTELVNASAAPATVIYNYRLVNLAGDDVSADQIMTLQPSVTNAACSRPETRDGFLKKGVSVSYSYSGSDGKFIAAFTVKPGDCAF